MMRGIKLSIKNSLLTTKHFVCHLPFDLCIYLWGFHASLTRLNIPTGQRSNLEPVEHHRSHGRARSRIHIFLAQSQCSLFYTCYFSSITEPKAIKMEKQIPVGVNAEQVEGKLIFPGRMQHRKTSWWSHLFQMVWCLLNKSPSCLWVYLTVMPSLNSSHSSLSNLTPFSLCIR